MCFSLWCSEAIFLRQGADIATYWDKRVLPVAAESGYPRNCPLHDMCHVSGHGNRFQLSTRLLSLQRDVLT